MSGDDRLADPIARLGGVSLAEVDELAHLQTRFDRKYLVTPDLAAELVELVADRSAVLEIDGRRSFTYRSRYFDTAELDSYRGAAFGRRGRFKVRTRTYADEGTAVLEVKTRGPRGTTVKVRLPHEPDAMDEIGADGAVFVDDHVGAPGLHRRLRPVLTTEYRRTTLVDATDRSRTTIDQDLVCTGGEGGRGEGHRPHGRLVLETKSTGAATAIDRLLWDRGERPVRISKFGVGMALHDPTLPANRWNRVLRHHFGWRPVRVTVDGEPRRERVDAPHRVRSRPPAPIDRRMGVARLQHAR